MCYPRTQRSDSGKNFGDQDSSIWSPVRQPLSHNISHTSAISSIRNISARISDVLLLNNIMKTSARLMTSVQSPSILCLLSNLPSGPPRFLQLPPVLAFCHNKVTSNHLWLLLLLRLFGALERIPSLESSTSISQQELQPLQKCSLERQC